MTGTHVSPDDVYGYLSALKRAGIIGGFERIRQRGRTLWRVETISTRYDHHQGGVEWASIVLTSREACAYVEGTYAARGWHPTGRAGAYRASWEANHVLPHPFSPSAADDRAEREAAGVDPDPRSLTP
jgi:hypothetical protein